MYKMNFIIPLICSFFIEFGCKSALVMVLTPLKFIEVLIFTILGFSVCYGLCLRCRIGSIPLRDLVLAIPDRCQGRGWRKQKAPEAQMENASRQPTAHERGLENAFEPTGVFSLSVRHLSEITCCKVKCNVAYCSAWDEAAAYDT